MFRHWFADDIGIATFAVAMATIVGAALAARYVLRRYSPRPSAGVALAVLGGSLLLPWLSYGVASAAATRPSPLPKAATGVFVHDLRAGAIRQLATVTDWWMTGVAGTVFQTASGRWHRATVPAHLLNWKDRAREAAYQVTSLPAAVEARVAGRNGDFLVGFFGVEALVVVAGSVAVASVVRLPRRVDLDRALARLVAEHDDRNAV